MEREITVGRIVHYIPYQPCAETEMEPVPMIVTKVHANNVVNGHIFLDGFPSIVKTDVVEGSGPGFWHWPPRV